MSMKHKRGAKARVGSQLLAAGETWAGAGSLLLREDEAATVVAIEAVAGVVMIAAVGAAATTIENLLV
jgi:hypothetical protein